MHTGLGPASQPFTGFGTAWFDYDNDDRLDIFVANGAVQVIQKLALQGDPYPLHQTNQLLRHEADGRYSDVTAAPGVALALSEVSRGAAFVDLYYDGDVDIVLGNNACV